MLVLFITHKKKMKQISIHISYSLFEFLQLNVNLLMVRGSADSSLVDACCFHDILILEHVPYRLLQLLGMVHKSTLLTYIADALQVNSNK